MAGASGQSRNSAAGGEGVERLWRLRTGFGTLPEGVGEA